MKLSELKEILNAINVTKEDVLSEGSIEQNLQEYKPFIVNRCAGSFADTVLLVNEMNIRPFVDKDMQFHFLINTIRKRKRYAKWLKAEKLDGLDAVKSYYEVGDTKAKKLLEIIDDKELERIKDAIYPRGGKQK